MIIICKLCTETETSAKDTAIQCYADFEIKGWGQSLGVTVCPSCMNEMALEKEQNNGLLSSALPNMSSAVAARVDQERARTYEEIAELIERDGGHSYTTWDAIEFARGLRVKAKSIWMKT